MTTEPSGHLGQARVLTGIWPGPLSRRQGIEPTEGQPDSRQTTQTKRNPGTMKKLIGGSLAAATATGALLFGAVPAQAESF